MAATLQHDDGPVLIVACDRCLEEIVAFGTDDSTRDELDARIAAEAWEFQGGSEWLCKKCGNGRASAELPDRVAAISVLAAPE